MRLEVSFARDLPKPFVFVSEYLYLLFIPLHQSPPGPSDLSGLLTFLDSSRSLRYTL